MRIKLYARANSTSSYYNSTFKVGVMTDPTNASTFSEVATYTPASTTYEQYVLPLDSYTGTGTYIAIMIEAAEAFGGNTYGYRSVFIDDIIVEPIPSCLEPSDLAATASTTSAELSWTANSGETAWTVYYKKTTDESYTEVANATPDFDTFCCFCSNLLIFRIGLRHPEFLLKQWLDELLSLGQEQRPCQGAFRHLDLYGRYGLCDG